MKALRFHKAHDLRIDDVPTPECGDDEVRLQVAFCGICGTDVHEYLAGPILCGGVVLHDLMSGKIPADPSTEVNRFTGSRLPQILGHELSAIISEVGKNVKNLTVGQRVVVNAAIDDRHHGLDLCEWCEQGRHNVCDRIHFYGVNSPQGGFADQMVVKAVAIVPIPNNVSLKVAALAEPLAVAAHMVRLSGFQPGQDAVVFGAGPIGTALIFLLKDSGARTVIVSEVAKSRLEQAKLAGADRTLDPTKEKVIEVVRNTLGTGGAHVAFDACGFQETLTSAIAAVKTGGTIFNVAVHEKPVQIDMNLLTIQEKRLMAGNAYTAEDFDRVIDLLAKRGKELERFITAVVPLEQAIEGGFEEVVKNKAAHNKILIEVGGGE